VRTENFLLMFVALFGRTCGARI